MLLSEMESPRAPSKKNKPMELESVKIEPADEGGFVVRCEFSGRVDGEHTWENKVKVFQTADELAKFIKKKLGEYDAEDDEVY